MKYKIYRKKISDKTIALLVITSILLVLIPITASADSVLYSISSDDDQLRVIDPSNGNTTSNVAITLSGETVEGGTGLATKPGTDELWALLKLSGQHYLRLVKINRTGAATDIGDTEENFSGLAFDSSGVLYGVTSDENPAGPKYQLFTLNTLNGAATWLYDLGAGDKGEAIAFNPVDEFLYHASGQVGECGYNYGVCFEKIWADGYLNNIDIRDTELIKGEPLALTYWESEGVFLWIQGNLSGAHMFQVTSTGDSTLIGNLDHKSKGLAFIESTTPGIPEFPTISLPIIAVIGLMFLFQKRKGK